MLTLNLGLYFHHPVMAPMITGKELQVPNCSLTVCLNQLSSVYLIPLSKSIQTWDGLHLEKSLDAIKCIAQEGNKNILFIVANIKKKTKLGIDFRS